ncbi:MAG: rhomboid family intramembrane serine protease [Pontiellaceae bacterium]|nr:rhomboid family intramembrane serine protease [Pontiellaceae bacterium]MBN2786086.1 rhomboid family intramembrane serine protease [Pontiellaceae bacterium]
MFEQSPRNIGGIAAITPSVKFLLILNVAVYILDSFTNPDPQYRTLANIFALRAHWWENLQFLQLFTYMFIHGSVSHLLLNMVSLFFIGPTVERTVGSYRFFILYYLSGILGGLGWSLLADPGTSCVGASGAVMGILGAFGALYPQAQLLLWFILPVRAWVLVIGLILWELFETVTKQHTGGIANAAHLVGAIAGVSYALALKNPQVVQRIRQYIPGLKQKGPACRTSRKSNPYQPDRLTPEDIDRILDKIGKEGMGALTPRERELLKRATRG